MTQQLHSEGYAVSQVCQMVGLPRSSYYYQPVKQDEQAVLKDIEKVLATFPTYGTRTTNSAHAYPRHPNRVKGLAIERPEQVWVSDITYIRLNQEFVYLAVVMDVYTRVIRGWQISRHLDQRLALDALDLALEDRLPEIHHSDQGVQYAARKYVDRLRQHDIQISMAAVGISVENPFAERVIRTIKDEEVNLADYLDFHDAYSQIGQFIDQVYRFKRIHASLGNLTPAEFEDHWKKKTSLNTAT